MNTPNSTPIRIPVPATLGILFVIAVFLDAEGLQSKKRPLEIVFCLFLFFILFLFVPNNVVHTLGKKDCLFFAWRLV